MLKKLVLLIAAAASLAGTGTAVIADSTEWRESRNQGNGFVTANEAEKSQLDNTGFPQYNP
jgi:hypothetical protein